MQHVGRAGDGLGTLIALRREGLLGIKSGGRGSVRGANLRSSASDRSAKNARVQFVPNLRPPPK